MTADHARNLDALVRTRRMINKLRKAQSIALHDIEDALIRCRDALQVMPVTPLHLIAQDHFFTARRFAKAAPQSTTAGLVAMDCAHDCIKVCIRAFKACDTIEPLKS